MNKPVGMTLLGPIRELRGYGYGLQDPSLIVKLSGTLSSLEIAKEVWEKCAEILPKLAEIKPPLLSASESLPATANWLLDVLYALQVSVGQMVHSPGSILSRSTDTVTLLVPTQPTYFVHQKLMISALISFCSDIQTNEEVSKTETTALADILHVLARRAPAASNTLRFFKASCELGIPAVELPLSLVQYGIGANSGRLLSSTTDATSWIASKLARNKAASLALLREAGLPTTIQRIATTSEVAIKIANKLGYPVVVKPNDLDGGVGVAAGLQNEQALVTAFERARQHSKSVLIEKHFFGNDYRLTVFQGALIWAIERVAASVDGNGVSTVQELIEETNADPKRGASAQSALKPIIVDDEVLSVLAEQGKGLDWVPPQDAKIKLRRISNIATGGYPIAVTDHVHPDNAALAIRAAAVLGLDLAGVDLLIPDITVPWHLSGAAICEINAQPTLGQTTASHLYGEILKVLVPKAGRIPSVLLVGVEDSDELANLITMNFEEHGLKVGVHTRKQVRLGNEKLGSANRSVFIAGRILASQRDAEAIVMTGYDLVSLQSGLGIPYIDALVLGKGAVANGQGASTGLPDLILALFLQQCDGVIFDLTQGGPQHFKFPLPAHAEWKLWAGDKECLAKQLVQEVLTKNKDW